MIEWELAQAMRNNIREHGYEGRCGINVFDFIMRCLNVDAFINIIHANQMAQPYCRQVQISRGMWEIVSEVILCNRSIGLFVYQDELHHMDTLEYVGQKIGRQLQCEVMDNIYVNGGVFDFRLDTEDDSPDVLMDKLWKASLSQMDKTECVMMYDKWILPHKVVDVLLPYLYSGGYFVPNDNDADCPNPTDTVLLGTYKGIKLYESHRNTVAILCYYGGKNDAGCVLVPYLMKTEPDAEFCGYRLELIYGLENLHPDYFVSLQVR